MREAGAIGLVMAQWPSPAAFVRKKNSTSRMCVDQRRMNTVKVRNATPRLRRKDCIDSLADAAAFTTLDCSSVYQEIEIAEADKNKTTLTSPSGLYRVTLEALRTEKCSRELPTSR